MAASMGAKWWYNSQSLLSEGILIIESIGDTIIYGQNCRILQKTMIQDDLTTPIFELDTIILSNEYVYEDNFKVYWLKNDIFYLLYDFTSDIGTSWQVITSDECDSIGLVQIKDTSSITINDIVLKSITVDTISGSMVGFKNSEIIELIGSLGYLFPSTLTEDCGFDLPYYGNLRCYEDDMLGLYSINILENCNYLVSTQISYNDYVFEISPNPFYSTIFIDSKYFPMTLFIYDNWGRLILQDYLVEPISLDLSNRLVNGIYFVRLLIGTYFYHIKLLKL